ncbi:hypothetical protein KC727_00250 [Candidatus Kaiserbacteria bacterium]|nr:hypothetical protein [Candidatus Kaiserbacteria bacterium]
MYIHTHFRAWLALGVALTLLWVSGVAAIATAQAPLGEEEVNTEGAVSCFDYYTFGSVQVDVAPYFSRVLAADPVLFGGEVINNNPYPLVDGQIWMKVFKQAQTDSGLRKENGEPLVDFVLVKDGITLTAGERMPIEFTWEVPEYAAAGNYTTAFFFTTAHRYNLLGLSFTDDVTGNTASFKVERLDGGYTPVVFDKNDVYLDGVPVSFALPPRHFAKDTAVAARTTLVNDSDEDRLVELTWTTYQWDGILASHQMATETRTVHVAAQSRKDVVYDTPTLDTAVTFIVAEAKEGDAKSLLNIRYVRDGIEETRLNFPSITSYPLTEGQPVDMFSCVHATNVDVVRGNTLTLTLADAFGEVLAEHTYDGDITGAMMAVAERYTPTRDHGTVSLTATLKNAGGVLEEITTTYDCAALAPDSCAADEADGDGSTAGERVIIAALSVLVVLVVLISLIRYVRGRRDTEGGGVTNMRMPNDTEPQP